jgi:membrane associated rhomboid family serine protease
MFHIFLHDFCLLFNSFLLLLQQNSLSMFRNLPPITKNLLIINLICFFADIVFQRYGIDFTRIFGLHYITALEFHVWQPLTYMFMHANFSHIFFNMFAVMMFAPALEERWGSQRFLIYYLVTGLGAAVVQQAVWALQLQPVLSTMDPTIAATLANRVVTIGASGAVFGILLAFGWLFPEVRMFILFIPIPIRARTLVIIYALIELFAGLAPVSGDNVAHFAHLGGMIFGWLLILWWRHRGYDGFDSTPWNDGRLKQWLKDKWQQLFPKRHPRIKRDDDSKDYSDYHYHKPL